MGDNPVLATGTFSTLTPKKTYCYSIINRKHPASHLYEGSLIPKPTNLIGEFLVIIYKCDKPNTSLYYFTLNISNSGENTLSLIWNPILEIYDFTRNESQTTKGAGILVLKSFLDNVLKDFIYKNRFGDYPLLWLGTIEESLKRAYQKAGFIVFGEYGHTISPLGFRFPKEGWSFLYTFGQEPPSSIEVSARDIETHISSYIPLDIIIPSDIIDSIYTHFVLEGDAEHALAFARFYKQEYKTDSVNDTSLVWNGTHFTGSPQDFIEMSTLTETDAAGQTVIPLSSNFFRMNSKNITGHTHPASIFAGLLSQPGSINQDISTPSNADYTLVLYYKCPLHLIFSTECVYSIAVNPELSHLDFTIPQDFIDFNNRIFASLCSASPDITEPFIEYIYSQIKIDLPRVPPPPYNKNTRILEVGPSDPRYLKYKQFRVKLACVILNLKVPRAANNSPLFSVQYHFYYKDNDNPTILTPPIRIFTKTPHRLFMSDVTKEDSIANAEKYRQPPSKGRVITTMQTSLNLQQIGKQMFLPCQPDGCPILRPSPTEIQFQIHNQQTYNLNTGVIPVGTSLYKIFIEAIKILPSADINTIFLGPTVGKGVWSRGGSQGPLKINRFIITGTKKEGVIQSESVSTKGEKIIGEVKYPFSEDWKQSLEKITIHTTPEGREWKWGGSRRWRGKRGTHKSKK